MAYYPGSISLKPFALSYSAVGTRLSKKRFASSRRPERKRSLRFHATPPCLAHSAVRCHPKTTPPREQPPNERACSADFSRRNAGAKIAATGRALQQLSNSVWSSRSAALSLRAI